MNRNTKTIYGIDFIRFVSMLIIVMFHCHEITFFMEDSPFVHLPLNQSLNPLIFVYLRAFSFSGFTIVFLTSLLMGLTFKPGKSRTKLLSLILIGTAVLMITQGDRPFVEIFIEWDIYAYLLFSFFVMTPVLNDRRLIGTLGLIGVLLLMIPFWQFPNWFSGMPLWVRSALVGVCDDSGRGGWPLLPWVGWVWAPYALGRYLQLPEWRRWYKKLHQYEYFAWLPLLAWGVSTWGPYYYVGGGKTYSCDVFRVGLGTFWGHMVWVVFLTRISFLDKVNGWLGRLDTIQFISGLNWSRRFGLCYLLHLLVISIGAMYREVMFTHPRIYDVFVLAAFPATELLSRYVVKIHSLLLKRIPLFTKPKKL